MSDVEGQYFDAKCQCKVPDARIFPSNLQSRRLEKVMKDRPIQEQLYQLSSQVTQLQLQLSLVLMDMKRKPLQPVPVNDNAADDDDLVA